MKITNNFQLSLYKLKDSTNYLTMYFVFKGDKEPVIRLVDLEEKIRNEFAEKFTIYLQKTYLDNELAIDKVSSADGRIYDVLIYDLEVPEPLKQLGLLLKDPDAKKYSHKRDKDLSIDGYIFILGNTKIKIALYKEHYNVDLITRDSYVMFGRRDSRFIGVTEEVFRINEKVDFVQIDKELFALDLKALERNFKFYDLVKKEATNFLNAIENISIIEDKTYIKQLVNDSPAYARKVLRVNTTSPVLKLPYKQIKIFIESHPHLKGQIKFNASGNKVVVDTKQSATVFLKLMDDDFLQSSLTKELYESIAKDRIQTNSININMPPRKRTNAKRTAKQNSNN